MIRIAILAVTLGLLGACTGMNNTEQGAVSGGAIGAAGGAIIGAAAGNPVAGAVVGGVAGAAVGGAIGNQQDQAQSH